MPAVGHYDLPRTPSFRLITHCCAIDRMLFVSQYSTSPAGKKKNMTENTSGMIHIIFAWTGSGGVGLSQTWNTLVAVISKGRMKYGSLADKSVIQPIHGAWRISTLDSSTQ